jgi:hypothetical protein
LTKKVSDLTPEQHEKYKATHRAAARKWRESNLLKNTFIGRKSSAKRSGIPWEIEYTDLGHPTHCPVLGIELSYTGGRGAGPKADSPSIDRINPKLGYVKGNVAVISHRANIIKQDASSAEIEKVAAWVRAQGL